MTLKKRLEEKGIKMKDLIDTALEMYIYDPRIGSKKKLRPILQREFRKVLQDINVCSLVLAGFLLEEELAKGIVPGLSQEKYLSDPVDLLADEILGIQIAAYISGTRSLFEFTRFDKQKPGILGKLPPMLDDVIAGLISGVLVKVCSV